VEGTTGARHDGADGGDGLTPRDGRLLSLLHGSRCQYCCFADRCSWIVQLMTATSRGTSTQTTSTDLRQISSTTSSVAYDDRPHVYVA